MDVLRLRSEGKSHREVAIALQLSDKAVKRHLDNVFITLGVSRHTTTTADALRSRFA
jgi:DNA-binding NarL/FixJ family response regulator